MLAAYVESPNFDEPLAALVVGEQPEPDVPLGHVRVRIEAASLNRHDLWTLRGVTVHPSLPLPMILGCDGSGRLDDGSPVVLYGGMGDPNWRGEETLDPRFHVLSELRSGTMADWIVVPERCVLPRPAALSAIEAAALGTAWLTAYKMLFVNAGLTPGQRMLIQGATGGVSTALVQLGCAAGYEVWATGRSPEKRALAERLGAHRVFEAGAELPDQVDAVFDTVGEATWAHSVQWVRRGGRIVLAGRTSGANPPALLGRLFVEQITVQGSVLGTLEQMRQLISFVVNTGIRPEIGAVLPLERAEEGFRAMLEEGTHGKTVFTRPAA